MRATIMYGTNDVRIEHVSDARLSQPVPFDWAGQVAAFLNDGYAMKEEFVDEFVF